MKSRKTMVIIFFSALALLAAPQVLWSAPLSDQSISDAVEDEIAADRAIPAVNIDITTANGLVTLAGTVDNLLAKDRAARIAETVKGVIAVQNNIIVTPPGKTADQVITERVKNALLYNPATESYQTSVSVSNGVATLRGTVDSFQEKQLAEKVTKGVKGVREVTNAIEISYRAPRPDSEITADIEQAFQWDALLYDAGIDVDVDNGVVRISGNVASAAEKSRALNEAFVLGVKSIDASELNVSSWDWRNNLAGGKLVRKNDRDIKAAIEQKMLLDAQVNSTAVVADVSGGVVTLRGKVDNLLGKRAAAEEARTTAGVTRVKNRIKVASPENVADARISNRIAGALAADPYVSRFDVNIGVHNGAAALAGSVNTYFEKVRAETVAAGIKGVTSIKNNLKIEDPASIMAYDPYLYDPYVYDLDWFEYKPVLTPRLDSEIKANIGDGMFWSPFVDADQVKVAVNRGVAILTGTVDSWAELQAATENALEGGATAVVNNLQIAG